MKPDQPEAANVLSGPKVTLEPENNNRYIEIGSGVWLTPIDSENRPVTSSTGLATAVADALGIDQKSIQLNLKTIRAAGMISFKGYGRSAAAMEPIDAARLVIAVAGSTFAKRSVDGLAAFARLQPLSRKGRKMELEAFLADLIDRLGRGEGPSKSSNVERRSDLAGEAALKLMWVAGRATTFLPRVAVVRWFRSDGKSDEATFASESLGLKFIDEARLARSRPQAGLIHTRTITARALLDISRALR